jgi:hypothetical protein
MGTRYYSNGVPDLCVAAVDVRDAALVTFRDPFECSDAIERRYSNFS